MPEFEGPTDLKFNRGLISDPEGFAREANAGSWLFLCGELRAWVAQGLDELALPAR
jgi:hypothetical protein